ncbi:MAG: nucleotidyltransferase substrate binding protein [Nitrospirae bacterium]|nr:nucleotidyltransferase substrate binding protein [Candidatus Troglogloeales bacterium]
MAYLKKKSDQLKKAMKSWRLLDDCPYSDIVRDATIQRFEFSFELLWKVVKIYLKDVHAIASDSPKACFRELRLPLNLSEKEVELCLKMADDRNLSVHTYSEEMAEKLYKRIRKYQGLCGKISEKISLADSK